ncbi:MAG TPA: GLUG motif-containing protein [Rhizomicrobium sp.]|jgi:filamentous hemagglutinin family protein|nr:GLUG motif-containing protein [Rhizomicrobium sp.]
MTCNRVTTSFRNTCSLSILAVALCAAGSAEAGALPGHGHYVAGQGSIAKSGQVLTIDQSSRTGIINWKTFSVGKGNSVVFDNAHGATLNRVTGGNMSRIAGALHGTGSVYLINNSGVAVLPTGRIVTQGSFAASGNSADGDGFGTRKRLLFTGGANGNVVNAGRITSATGQVALYGRNVTDTGSITARNASLIAARGLNVSGSVAATGGHGRIETSGGRVQLGGAHITGASWLIDPKNLTVKAGSATTIQNSLNAGTNVKLKTTATSASGPGTVTSGEGDIIVSAPITWSGTATLTLDAYAGININSLIHLKGKGGLNLQANDGSMKGALTFGSSGAVNFASVAGHLTINGDTYKLVDSIHDLAQGIALHPTGDFALASDIDAGGTVYAAVPISKAFNGDFDGLGNTISNFSLNDSSHVDIGLFRTVGANGHIENVNLANANITGMLDESYVGGLAATSSGTIANVSVSGKILGGYNSKVGGVVGDNASTGSINNVHSTGRVTAGDDYADIGGVAGENDGTVSNSSSSADMNGGYYPLIGGLVGYNTGTITGSSASGDVNGDYESTSGGLVGENYGGTITSSHASGNVNGGYSDDDGGNGGLVGYTYDGKIVSSHASGNVTGDYEDRSGGLVGYDEGTPITASHASGDVNGGAYGYGIGGLVGYVENDGTTKATIQNSYATGDVTSGEESYLGGLVGEAYSTIIASHATGNVSGGYDSYVGGLTGYAENIVKGSYATGNVSAGYDSYVGGLVGYQDSGAIMQTRATGDVYGGYEDETGGLVGFSGGTITGSHATGAVSGGYGGVGGLVGESGGTIDTSYATGDVDGFYETEAGGLVGYNYGSITQSFATGNTTSDYESYAGGLVGENTGGISNVYATGDVSGYDADVGGLVGYNSGTAHRAYSSGAVTGGTSTLGGSIGYDGNTTAGHLSFLYWDTTTSGITDPTQGVGNVPSADGVAAKTNGALKTSLPAGFLASVWTRTGGVNGGLPYLKSVPPQ